MSNSETYGVGPAAVKKNIGATVNAVSVLQDDGSVVDNGEVVFDPKDDAVALKQDDGKLSAQAEGEDVVAEVEDAEKKSTRAKK